MLFLIVYAPQAETRRTPYSVIQVALDFADAMLAGLGQFNGIAFIGDEELAG